MIGFAPEGRDFQHVLIGNILLLGGMIAASAYLLVQKRLLFVEFEGTQIPLYRPVAVIAWSYAFTNVTMIISSIIVIIFFDRTAFQLPVKVKFLKLR
jgi:drug/metabolite transporter (DMT)-like permease